VHDISVRAVDADDVDACRDGAGRRRAVAPSQLVALGGGQLTRHLPSGGRARDRRRCDRRQSGDGGLRGAAAVVELHADEDALDVGRVGESPQRRDAGVVVQPELACAALAVGADVGRLDGHQGHARADPLHEVVEVLLGEMALGVAVVAFHRRGRETVPQRHASHGERSGGDPLGRGTH
jgi:hypothetical protein